MAKRNSKTIVKPPVPSGNGTERTIAKLIVTPIDPTARGSYRKRQRIRKAQRMFLRAEEIVKKEQKSAERERREPSVDVMTGALDMALEGSELADDIVLENVTTTNGVLDEVLDQISEREFYAILQALMTGESEDGDLDPTQSEEASSPG